MSLGRAWPTLAVYLAIFVVLVDRRRPSGWLAWLFALAWGAGASTMLSLIVNSWAGDLLGNDQTESAGANMRTAVYIAPFVEEAAKASVIFLLAALYRGRLVNKLNIVALGGISAVGFAFTENIIYYLRAAMYATREITAGDAYAALDQMQFLRGVLTSWGHPLFTSMTAFGIAVGLRNRSRLARILYPLAGFLMAALEHMFFNLQASSGGELEQLMKTMQLFMAMVALTLVTFLLTNWLREGRLIRDRLTDYQRMGWLRDGDPVTFSSALTRIRLVGLSLLVGLRTWWATVRLIRAHVELAYLRDSMTRGLVDSIGLARERELLEQIRLLRTRGIDTLDGWRRRPFFWLPWLRRIVPAKHQPAAYPGPAGLGGNWPYPTGPAAPLGRTQYSAVDPSWAPPS